jgi:integrase
VRGSIRSKNKEDERGRVIPGTTRYEARWRAKLRDPKTGELRWRWRGKTFPTKAQAQRYLNGVLTDIERQEYVDPMRGRTKLGEVAEAYLETAALNLKAKTVYDYRSIYRTHVAPYWSTVPVGEIDFNAVQSWVASMPAPSARGGYKVLRLVLGYAVRSGVIRANPCSGEVTLPRKPKREMSFLTHAQVEALAEAIAVRPKATKHGRVIERPDLGSLVRFAAYSGLRSNEITALRVRHLDLAAGTVSVEEGTVELAGQLLTDEPKTKTSRRLVNIDEDLCALLRSHLGDRRLQPNAYVFTGVEGGQRRHSNFAGRFFREAVARCATADPEFPAGLRFHDLRHTYASLLFASGASVKEVQESMGHTTAQITLDLYTHLMPGAKAAAAARLGEARRAALATEPAAEVVELR